MSRLEQPPDWLEATRSRRRRWAEMQGFVGLTDGDLSRIDPWLRFSPAICAAWAAVATLAHSSTALLVLAGIAVLGAVRASHPFDAVYNLGVRRVTGSPAIPRYGTPRRFACSVAAAWLAATAAAFARGATTAGVALGVFFTAVALVPVMTGFCVPSFVFQQGCRLARDRGSHAPTTT